MLLSSDWLMCKDRGRVLAVALGLAFTAAFQLAGCRCGRDEPPPLLVSPSAEPSVSTQIQLEAEDAGTDAASDAEAGVRGGRPPGPSLKACCAALRQNAASAPPPTNGYMLNAAGVCDGMVSSGADRNSALAAIRSALSGTPVPPGCL